MKRDDRSYQFFGRRANVQRRKHNAALGIPNHLLKGFERRFKRDNETSLSMGYLPLLLEGRTTNFEWNSSGLDRIVTFLEFTENPGLEDFNEEMRL